MRDLKYGKTMMVLGVVGLVETLLVVILMFAVKDSVIESIIELMRQDPAVDQAAIDLFVKVMSGSLIFAAIWAVLVAIATMVLSYFSKKNMGFNIALVAISAISGLGGISSILIIIFGILNIIDASKRNKELKQTENISY
ncbi:hypothetical protein LJC17_01810 [Acholeplasma sp. OttesenSCG-928-E16]|nr:hypothetical protein [Acholeplasma sp. OttesenSCG-928-E16]